MVLSFVRYLVLVVRNSVEGQEELLTRFCRLEELVLNALARSSPVLPHNRPLAHSHVPLASPRQEGHAEAQMSPASLKRTNLKVVDWDLEPVTPRGRPLACAD